MKKLKKYTKEEIKILQEKYNALVKPSYKADWVGMQYVLADVHANQNLILPYIEIGCKESIDGVPGTMYLDWVYKYRVRVMRQEEMFFIYRITSYRDGSKDYFIGDKAFINDIDTAKQVYEGVDNGRVELLEYNGANDWEHYNILQDKYNNKEK